MCVCVRAHVCMLLAKKARREYQFPWNGVKVL